MDTWCPLVVDQCSASGGQGSESHAHSWVSLRTWKILFSPFHPQTEHRVLKGGGNHRAEECRGRAWTGPGESRDQDLEGTADQALTFDLPRDLAEEAKSKTHLVLLEV